MSIQTGNITPDLAGAAFLYAGKSACGSVPRFVVSMTMHVRRDVLEDALNDILPLFPHLAVKISGNGAEYRLEHDCSRVPVSQADTSDAGEKGKICGDGRLFAVSCGRKSIFFDVHSSLLDERGMAAFAKAVAFRYIQLYGLPVANDGSVRAVSDGGSLNVSTEDPLELVRDIPASRPVWYMDAKAFSIPSSESESCFVTQVRIPVGRLRAPAREYAGTPVTFISPLVSHAVYEEFGEEMSPGEYVVAAVTVNLRQHFPTLSLRPFCTSVNLAYNRRLGDYPFNTILMSQKKFLEAQLKPDALAYNVQCRIASMEEVMDAGDAEARMRRSDEVLAHKAAASTYMIRDAGMVSMPESLSRYITEFYPVYAPDLHDFTLSSVIFRNEIVLTVAQKRGRSLGRRIVELMNANGVISHVSDEFEFIPGSYRKP